MRLIGVAVVLTLSLVLRPLGAEAQPPGKIPRVGYLSSHSPERFRVEVFRQALHELGWVEGRNLIIDYRSADGKFDRLPELAAQLVGLKVEVIVAAATMPALAAKTATQTIPIVFTHVSDPVGSGLVSSLARPGGNITGFSLRGTPQPPRSGAADAFQRFATNAEEILRLGFLAEPSLCMQPLLLGNGHQPR
jgi:ABC-type uncharacterized transport system substrate-binding protein